MAEKFQNKYRIASARAQWWDYGWNGAYFITICTQNREHYFGKITDAKMILSHLGVIADVLWREIPNHTPFVQLGDFVVMPNHIHGILILNKPKGMDGDGMNDTMHDNPGVSKDDNGNDNVVGGVVEALHATPLQHQSMHSSQHQSLHSSQQSPPETNMKNEKMSAISPKSNSVSTIIRSYKSAVTKHANRLGFENGWQTRFYDHIIRNDAEYQRISDYIVNNPKNWGKDKFYTEK